MNLAVVNEAVTGMNGVEHEFTEEEKNFVVQFAFRSRRQQFKSQMRQPRPGSGITKHKCAICGRTELDDPNLEFRFCSKCDGNYEYCQDHLFTHKHIKKG